MYFFLIYIYIYTHTHTHIYIYTYTYIHIYTINNALYSTRSRLHVINIYCELEINVISNIKFINYIYV